ncbi:hypothetical protein [Melittangium boletus]|uniref:hypothetical protein n=1 Tax=Melittangium boletus TaxID=83453 RepID=UPI003DA5A092
MLLCLRGMTARFWLLAVVLGVLASGCVTTGMARPVDPGTVQVSVAGGIQNVGSPSSSSLHFYSFPQAEVGVRVGVKEGVDLGAKFFLAGAAVDGRFSLLRAPSLQKGVDLTLAPGLLYWTVGTADTSLTAELPLLLGLNFGGSQLVLGARAGAFVDLNDTSRPRNKPDLMLGASVGYAIPLTPWLRLMPELNLRTRSSESDVMLLGSLGVIVGGYSTSS